ncbi:MAG: UDP-N-acetylmuramoyl-L-alanyl-D-glutamate--2,6-diaminopimelate ligase [Clostridia bacterium]|nr:UDP-N-acetylmuramoyl-L-alanyl-D-glutamate--2,6-diaminopimelate ligase [Clostridia bacterium]
MKLSTLFPPEGISGTIAPDAVEVFGASVHTDKIKTGDLFIAKRGAHTDPLSLLDTVVERGAAAILTARGTEIPATLPLPVFFAEDLAGASCHVFDALYGYPARSLRLFAVTGTNGKTTVAQILSHLFSASGVPCGYIGTLGASLEGVTLDTAGGTMTTPEPDALFPLLCKMKQRGALAVVMEVSSHALALGRVKTLAFESAIFTNLTEDHLDFHKDMESYYLAKQALFSQSELAVVNVDDAYGERLAAHLADRGGRVCRVGAIQAADYRLSEWYENGLESTKYLYCSPYNEFFVEYPLYGAFNAYNTLLAVTAAIKAGLCPEEIRHALLSLPKPRGRAEVLSLPLPFTVIIDYAHTPDAMEKVIRATRRQTRGKLFVLFGAGGDREKEKRPFMGRIAEELADFAVVSTDNPRSEAREDIFADILSGMSHPDKYTVIPDRAAAICWTLDRMQEDDVLLLLGKGHEEYLIEDGQSVPFSERTVIENYVKRKRLL